MDFEGVGEVTGAQTLSYTHKVIPVLPSISLVKADKESAKAMTFKITNTSDEDTLSLKAFDVAITAPTSTYVIKNTANNKIIWDGSSATEEVSIAPNKSVELSIMSNGTFGNSSDGKWSVRAILNNITFTTDDGDFLVDSTMSNVAKWTDLDVSYTL